MALEIISVDIRILNLLSGDTTLQGLFGGTVAIFNEEVPQDTPTPYIVYDEYTNSDANAVGGHRIFNMAQYLVQCVGKNTGFYTMKGIVNRVDYLLTETAPVVVENVYVGGFIRESVIRNSNRDDEDTWYFLGGIYRLMNHASN